MALRIFPVLLPVVSLSLEALPLHRVLRLEDKPILLFSAAHGYSLREPAIATHARSVRPIETQPGTQKPTWVPRAA